MVVSTSSALPITGSSLPSLATSVRSRLYSSSVGVELAGPNLPAGLDAAHHGPAQPGVREPEAREEPAGIRLLVCREGEQNVLGPDVRGAQGPGLVVGREQRPLGVRGQRRGDVCAPTLWASSSSCARRASGSAPAPSSTRRTTGSSRAA